MNLKQIHEELHLKGNYPQAEQMYLAILDEHPDNWLCLFFIGTLFLQTNRNGLAIQCFERAVYVKPHLAEVWNNLGTAYKRENHNEKAKQAFLRSSLLKKDAETFTNLSTVFINEGCPEQGVLYSDLALKMAPNHVQGHWNRSLIMLEQGRYGEGFDEYFWGLRSKDRMNRDYNAPIYSGEKGKRVVVWGEQGIGDEIMFSSIIPDLQKRSKDVIFDCHPRLKGLFERSFAIKCYPTRKEDPVWMWDERIDAKTPIGGLGSFFRRDIKDFPGTPYLVPDPERVKKVRERLEATGPGPYVGISWSGGKKKTRVDLRSIALKDLLPLKECGVTLVNLQYTKDTQQDAIAAGLINFPDIIYAHDYDETAALVAALDLVVSVNTSVIHLAGALGKECWIMTPVKKAWRYYSPDGVSMPWYKSARIYQQEKPGEWGDVISKVKEHLTSFGTDRAQPDKSCNSPGATSVPPNSEKVA